MVMLSLSTILPSKQLYQGNQDGQKANIREYLNTFKSCLLKV